jgi:hypothetical protein
MRGAAKATSKRKYVDCPTHRSRGYRRVKCAGITRGMKATKSSMLGMQRADFLGMQPVCMSIALSSGCPPFVHDAKSWFVTRPVNWNFHHRTGPAEFALHGYSARR